MVVRLLVVLVGGLLLGLAIAGVGILGFDALSAALEPRTSGPFAPAIDALPLLETALVLAGLACGLLAVAAVVFRRRPLSFLTTAPRFRWALFLTGFVLFGALQAVAVGATVGLTAPHAAWSIYPASGALMFCLAALVFYVPAVLAEEVVFRSWLLSADTGVSRRNLILAALSGLAFSAMHLQADPLLLALHLSSGLAYAWAAIRLGGVEFAVGAHLAKNAVLAVMLGFPGRHVWGDEFTATVLINIAASAALVGVVEIVRRGRERAVS